MATRRFRWLWTSIPRLRPESPSAQQVWQQLTGANHQALQTRAAYWQTDANPDLARVLADLQRQHIRRIGRGLRLVATVFVGFLVLTVTVALLPGGHFGNIEDFVRMALPLLPAMVFLLPSRWGYQAACRYNDAVVARAHQPPPSPAWGPDR